MKISKFDENFRMAPLEFSFYSRATAVAVDITFERSKAAALQSSLGMYVVWQTGRIGMVALVESL